MRVSRISSQIGAYLSRLYTLAIRREFAAMDGACIWWNARIGNPQHIRIGHGVTVRARSWIYAVVSDQTGRRFEPSIEIADGVYLGHGLHLTAVEGVTIESEVMIADSVYLSDNFHDYRDISTPVLKQRVFSKGPLRIRTGAFVGEGARVIGPVTVGRNAVIGANAVVTRDVPDYSVAVGIPARVIRRYDKADGQWKGCNEDLG